MPERVVELVLAGISIRMGGCQVEAEALEAFREQGSASWLAEAYPQPLHGSPQRSVKFGTTLETGRNSRNSVSHAHSKNRDVKDYFSSLVVLAGCLCSFIFHQ